MRRCTARGSDLLLQPGDADGAEHDVIADDIAGRAGDAERPGESRALPDGGATSSLAMSCSRRVISSPWSLAAASARSLLTGPGPPSSC